ncbi:TraI [Klebsiella pneumoniae]|nr:TraI [Klebsiella pneumoniae]STU48632.1 TraI [Klebsiella pneumoniae]SUY95085.1 TraI [Klebsiella pneumoniae]
MLPLLSADLFGGVKTDDEGVSFTFPPQLAKVNPEPLPPERYEEQAPELNRTEHEPTDIPSAEYPDAQEDDVEQFWVDYASYSYGDDCINSETGPINQTCESADVDVAQDKKSLSDRTPDNSTSVHVPTRTTFSSSAFRRFLKFSRLWRNQTERTPLPG